IGADVMRWMFCAANPAVNLNFGYGPGHEAVRRFFLPLWNTYAFFVAYARLDRWLPGGDGDGSGRSLLDRWILSRLDALTADDRARDAGHLADFPSVGGARRDEALESAVDRARRIVALGHAARSASGIRVRQPLPVLRLRRGGGGGMSEDPIVDRELTTQVLD